MSGFTCGLVCSNRRFLAALGAVLGVVIFQPLAGAQTVLIGQKSSDGHFRFEAAEELLINQSRRIKLAPEGEPTLDASSSKSLERIDISRAGVLRGDGKGRLFRVSGGSRERVLPENFAVKDSVALSALHVPLIITVVKNRKTKESVNIAPEFLYVYVSGAEPDLAAQRFVTQASNFSTLDEQLSAIVGFVRSFPDTPAIKNFRGDLRARLEAARSDYDEGGSYQALLDAAKMCAVAKEAFPSDKGLAGVATDIENRIRSTAARVQLLQGLAGLDAWDSFLTDYQDIELHANSFPELKALHRRALEEETRTNCMEARALKLRHREAEALQRFETALSADPNNPEITKQMANTRMSAAHTDAHKDALSWKPLPKDSPEDRLFRQALYTAQRAIQDHDYTKAQQAIKQAEAENAGAPEVLLAQASLLASGDQISAALPLLDRYDGMVTDASDREKGDAVRNQVIYELQKQKEASHREIAALLSSGEYTRLYTASTSALKLDAMDPELLYAAGVSASILHKRDEAKVLMDSYLKHSDNLAGDDASRIRVRRVLAAPKEQGIQELTGTKNWFSGQSLAKGAYYCPLSLAFQVPVDTVSGYKFRMIYSWEHGRLAAIHTEFEDEKGRQDYATLASRGAGGHGKNDGSVGNFVFIYDGSGHRVRAIRLGEHTKSSIAKDQDVRLLKNADGSVRLVDAGGDAEVVLRDDPLVNTEVVRHLLGPVTTLVSGNSYFNPFIWDGVHHFTVSYDDQGRVSTAKEWNTDNLVRFSWDKQRLTEVAAYHGNAVEPYYRRKVSYSGEKISAEEYTTEAHSGRIKYVYTKDVLTSARLEDGGVHDGKTWVARLQTER